LNHLVLTITSIPEKRGVRKISKSATLLKIFVAVYIYSTQLLLFNYVTVENLVSKYRYYSCRGEYRVLIENPEK
jgi:hypothetical protein